MMRTGGRFFRLGQRDRPLLNQQLIGSTVETRQKNQPFVSQVSAFSLETNLWSALFNIGEVGNMRRLFLCAILMVSLFVIGCADSSLTASTSVQPGSTENQSPTATPAKTSVDRIQLNESLLQDLLAEHHLAYSNPFSQGYPDVLTTPVFVHYSADHLYYRSYEEMPFFGEKYPMTVP